MMTKPVNSLHNWGVGSNSPLAEFALAIHQAPPAMIEFINARTFPIKARRGSYILKPGETCNHIYLITKGILRAFIREGNKELTTWIIGENEMATSIRGMTKREPSLEYIQALEDCELVGASFTDLQFLYDNFPDMNIIGRKLLEQHYMAAEERAYIGRIPSAEKKYRHFIQTRSELINRIPLKYIASFLSMTVETISRIRSKKNI